MINQINHKKSWFRHFYSHYEILLNNHIFFVVRAEEFHGIIVASHSCTAYLCGTLIAL